MQKWLAGSGCNDRGRAKSRAMFQGGGKGQGRRHRSAQGQPYAAVDGGGLLRTERHHYASAGACAAKSSAQMTNHIAEKRAS